MNVKRMLVQLTICMLVAWALPLARADSYGFSCLSANSLYCTDVAKQLTFTVTAQGTTQVLFTFVNSGPLASSVADILFDDGSLLGIATVVNPLDHQVSFSQVDPSATPPLQGGNSLTPAFSTTAGFAADADPPPSFNGVGPGEDVGIIFNLISGKTVTDTTAALADGSLRIGIHVQAMPDGQSDGFINTTLSAIPEPTSIVLLGTALLAITNFVRKRFVA